MIKPRLGESHEDFERRRIRESLNEADRLNEEQADIPLRDLDKDPPVDHESYDTPEMTHDAIARMAAARGKTVRVPLPPPPPPLVRAPPPMPTRRLDPPSGYPPLAMQPALPAEVRAEFREMAMAVVSELGRGLAQKFDDLKEDIEANTRLLAVMNAPMEAITDSHERAASSFETLRRDIADGIDTSPAIAQLSRLVDNAGLSEAQSRAEKRFEELAKAISDSLLESRAQVKASLEGVVASMVQVLHLLERLLDREAREMKRRAAAAGTPP
jgi:hypothetical protein